MQDTAARRSAGGPGGTAARRAADRACRQAWWSLALYPVTFGAAFAIGEGLISTLAGDPGEADVWEVLAAAVPALIVFAIPAILAVTLGRKAMRLGRQDGRVPAIVGAAISTGFIFLNVASYLVGLIVSG
jgi:hypothetical protein